MSIRLENVPQNVWKHVAIATPDACWLWTAGARTKSGYGSMRLAGRQTLAHRIVYELVHGPIPPGLFVLHRCDNPRCCNPSHLFLGTIADNNADANRKGRRSYPRGSQHHQAKLTEAQVHVIRQRRTQGETIAGLAREFGVSTSAIGYAVRGQTWRHLEAA